MATPQFFRLTCELGKSGIWFITSDDIRGLLVANVCLEDAISAVPAALAELALAEREGK